MMNSTKKWTTNASVCVQPFQKIKEDEISSLSLYQNQNKDTTRKLQTNISDEHRGKNPQQKY
jgi:hypothetical protein